MGFWKTDFQLKVSQWKIVSEYDQEIPQSQTADNPVVCNSFPANVISLNKILSYPKLSRSTERQKVHFIVFKTVTQRIGEARNCLKYSFYFASEQIEYLISVHWRVVSIYWALMWWVIHHSISSTKRSSSCWSLKYLLWLGTGLMFAL